MKDLDALDLEELMRLARNAGHADALLAGDIGKAAEEMSKSCARA